MSFVTSWMDLDLARSLEGSMGEYLDQRMASIDLCEKSSLSLDDWENLGDEKDDRDWVDD